MKENKERGGDEREGERRREMEMKEKDECEWMDGS